MEAILGDYISGLLLWLDEQIFHPFLNRKAISRKPGMQYLQNTNKSTIEFNICAVSI